MKYTSGNTYHIYNRGNNKNTIFFQPHNYLYFLEKVRKFLLPTCDLLNYCLMPNHFHFLVHANEITELQLVKGCVITNPLSDALKLLLSSYTKAINVQQHKTGHLFQQNTKSKLMTTATVDYSLTCFHYIHQNPLKAELVKRIEEWPYSSFHEYIGTPWQQLCNKELAFELLGLNSMSVYIDAYQEIDFGRI